jgi:hypothetical protein
VLQLVDYYPQREKTDDEAKQEADDVVGYYQVRHGERSLDIATLVCQSYRRADWQTCEELRLTRPKAFCPPLLAERTVLK